MLTLMVFLLSFVIAFDSTYGLENQFGNYDAHWRGCVLNRPDHGSNEKDVEIFEAPFQLELQGLYWERKELRIMKCGASIITTDAALTAKHCITRHNIPLSKLWVRAGSSIADQGKVYLLRKILLYSYFPDNRADTHDDIAIIFTKKPFKWSRFVQPIKIPSREPEDGLRASVTGWGVVDMWRRKSEIAQNRITSLKLKRGTLPIIKRKECIKLYNEEHFELSQGNFDENLYVSHNNYICAGDPSLTVAACLGDGGGPLYYNNTLHGIMSGGLGCALECRPNLFTNVYRYVEWIAKELRKDDLEGK